ncbi:MAG: hypothetical protein AAF568_01415 [Pseudomonadota bacterium]
MKIVEQTADRLVLVSRPWIAAVMVWGSGVFLLLGGVFAPGDVSFWQRLFLIAAGMGLGWIAWRYFAFATIRFDRTSGQMYHEVHRLMAGKSWTLPLASIHGARLEAGYGDDGGAGGTRVVLETERGIWPLESAYRPRRHDDVVTAILTWLSEPSA